MISLSEVQASLALFAEAIDGDVVPLTIVGQAGECWPWARRDPAGEVRLPVEAASRTHYRAILLHQLLATPAVSVEHPPLADARFNLLFEMVEDHRVRAETNRRYPGATPGLVSVLADVIGTTDEAPVTFLGDLRRYCLGVDRRRLGTRGVHGEHTAFDAVLDRVDLVTADSATGEDSRRIALQLLGLLGGIDAGRAVSELVDELPDESGEAVGTEATTGVSLEAGTPDEFIDDEDGAGGGQLLGDIDGLTTPVEASDRSERPPVGLEVPASGSNAGRTSGRTFVYDEWDYRTEDHRRAWCRVTEDHLEGDDPAFIADVRHRYQALRSKIRRSMMHMPPQELVRVHRRYDGDELDLDAAIEALSDRRGGAPVDDRLRIRRDRAARDVATAFLVDLSASTSSPAVPPEPEPMPEETDPFDDPMSYGPIWGAPPVVEPVRRVIDVAKDAVALMGDALDELGDRHAIYGFSGTGRDGVEFKVGKDFDDRVSPASWAAIGAMKPLRYTRMGPAVRHASMKLSRESARTKLLIVLSDGYPQDTDYGYDRHDRDYGLHDTARALADAAAIGIDTFCVTIDPAGHDYLRQMLPRDRYLVIDDVESLPEQLARLYFLTMRR